MKTNIKTVLTASLMLACASLQAVSPGTIAKLETEREKSELQEQNFSPFLQLPKDLQTVIIASINESPNAYEAAKRVGQLRRVNKLLQSIVDSPYSGKFLMQKIADHFPLQKMDLYIAAFKLGTPGSLAWLKEQFESLGEDAKRKTQFNFALAKAIKTGKLNATQIIELVGDPNYIVETRTNKTLLFIAAEAENEENKVTLLTDLIAVGADVNKIATHVGRFGEAQETILDLPTLNDAIRELLRSKGAKTAVELEQGQ